MKTFDRIFAALFAFCGGVCLYGVIFKGATWHIITVALCAILVAAFMADAKKEEKTENETTDEGYDKVNDHHPYPQEFGGIEK